MGSRSSIRNIKDAILFPWPRRKSFIEEIRIANKIEDWCEKYLIGPYTGADAGVYIYKKSDAVLYRLRWNNV